MDDEYKPLDDILRDELLAELMAWYRRQRQELTELLRKPTDQPQ